MESFWENQKSRKLAVFWPFWANFGYVSHIPVKGFWCHCGGKGPFGCRITVQTFMKIVWTVFEKFEIERSGEKKTKKQHDCISSRKFFPTPKNHYNSCVLLQLKMKLSKGEKKQVRNVSRTLSLFKTLSKVFSKEQVVPDLRRCWEKLNWIVWAFQNLPCLEPSVKTIQNRDIGVEIFRVA